MPEPQLYMSAQSFFGLVPETVRGTPITPATAWLPYTSPTLTPQVTWLDDDDMRGSPTVVFDEIAGVRHDEFEMKGNVHLDSFPNLLVAAGFADTISGAGPTLHTMAQINAAATGSQPKSYTLYDFNGYICQQIAGATLDSLQLDFNAMDAVVFTAKWLGQPNVTVALPTTETFSSTDRAVPGWSNAVAIATVANATLQEGSFTLDRSTEAVHAAGQQAPVVTFQGPSKVTGKMTFLVVTSEAITSAALAQTQQALTFTFTDPASTHTMLAQMSKVQFMNPVYTRDGIYLKVTVDFTAVANTTDASAGYAPIKFAVSNAQTAAY